MNTLFREIFKSDIEHTYKAPARINLIGEHIDYNGGKVFPCAIDKYITAYVSTRKDKELHLFSKGKDLKVHSLDNLDFNEKMRWEKYPLGAFYILSKKGYNFPFGLNIYYESEIPVGSGLSSSAALLDLTVFLISDIYKFNLDRKEVTLIAKAVENDYLHLKSGIMDQAIIALGVKDSGMLLDCNSFSYTYHDVNLGKYEFVVLKSNKPRSLVESKYNERVEECEKALSTLKKVYKINKLVDLSIDQLNNAKVILYDDILYRRVKHVVTEVNRVNRFLLALNEGNILELGKILDESHLSLKDDYEVTGFHLDSLFAASKDAGAIGARMTGAGFGGCAIALIEKEYFPKFKKRVTTRYFELTGLKPDVFEIKIVNGVSKIN